MIHDRATTPEHDHIPRAEHERITRRNLISSLAIGIVLGLIGGAPLGWFAHRLYYQQRAGQVLLCRQQHIGQTEAELKALCGSLY
ncbi:MAG: hypothetical protein LDL41_17260 [Coleofasciculus sp. S288]|nr:hypothetical protein [Coleofasciculus sp. S288]